MLEIKNLTKYYGNVLGVKDLNLKLEGGEIFGFVGPNGAGKSTTIRCIMNLINKTSGDIYIDNILVNEDNYNLKEMVGYLPGEVNLYEDMTVKEILDYSAAFYLKDTKERRKYLIKKLKIEENKKIEDLSLGNLKKVGIVLAMLHEPKLLILDEATSGLDPLMQEEFYDLLLEEKKKGTTIFFSSHILNEIKRVCDRVGIIKEGKLIKVEEVSNLNNNNLHIITIKSKDINKLKIDKYISKEHDKIKFIYDQDINKLLEAINKMKIDNILIEEPSIEEILMHYYK